MSPTTENNSIVIYQTEDGLTSIDVKMEDETVWLTQQQMAELFQKDRTVISRHIRNIFKEGELNENITCAKFAHMGVDEDQVYQTTFYNLDVIISVGYRVKSKRGTQFRIWANRILKDYLLKGYVINKQLQAENYTELKQLVQVLGRTFDVQENISLNEAHNLVNIVKDYTYALDTLDNYDYQRLSISAVTPEENFYATYENAMEMIGLLKEKFGGSSLFGTEKDESFRSSIGQIYQTFGGLELYPSVEEKAAMLLYLVIKNHSFVDGNKRIAATLFLWFMEQNGILYNADGSKRLSNGTLVALCLMIAESRSEEKDVMTKVVVNLINKNN